jgi:proliferating cell nuclear antigen
VTFTSIVQAETFQDWLEPVAALVDECKIAIGDSGLAISAVDPANVGCVDTNLDADAFESYEANVGEIGVNLDRLSDVVGFGSSGQLVQLELDRGTGKLHVTVGVLDYTLALIDPDTIRQEPELPELGLPLRAVLQGDDLSTMVEAADMVADHVALGGDLEDRALYSDAQGDTDDATVTYAQADLIDYEGADVHSLFSLDYLKDMSGAIPDDAEVTIRLGDSMPARMDYALAEGRASVRYQLAPRIKEGS